MSHFIFIFVNIMSSWGASRFAVSNEAISRNIETRSCIRNRRLPRHGAASAIPRNDIYQHWYNKSLRFYREVGLAPDLPVED